MKVYPQKKNVDDDTGYLCRYVRMETEPSFEHRHQYFELFVVSKGSGLHIINGTEQILSEGDLLFVRDSDAHYYRALDGKTFEFVNLAFSKDVFYSMLAYLGEMLPSHELLNAKMPPMTTVTKKEKESLVYSMLNLNTDEDTKTRGLKFRSLLLRVFTDYFFSFCDTDAKIPLWLTELYTKMKKPQNFILGTKKLFSLAGKSREHVSRSFIKYYGISPSQLVLDLRLSYSANLLLISNLSITEVCFESGFENLSWFYKAFDEKFGMTPKKYRLERKDSTQTPLSVE